jgi:hypothetical protein
MSTIAQPTVAPPIQTRHTHLPSSRGYWIAGLLAVAALIGGVAVGITQPTGRVIYYEGDDTPRFEDLNLHVTDPNGAAVATFTAERAGAYTVDVDGVDTDQLTIGDSFARRALPGVLTGVGIVALGLIAGLVLAVVTFIRRSNRATDARTTT